MIDPNLLYKAKFAELTALLGRTPVTTDSGWLELQEEYKRSWQSAEETVLAPRVVERENGNGQVRQNGNECESHTGFASSGTGARARTGERCSDSHSGTTGNDGKPQASLNDRAAGTLETGSSREPAPQARAVGEEAGAREGQGATGGPRANQSGERAGSAGGWSTGALRDCDRPMRGAGGGVLAVCEGCGQEWERERRRGRPSLLCGECR